MPMLLFPQASPRDDAVIEGASGLALSLRRWRPAVQGYWGSVAWLGRSLIRCRRDPLNASQEPWLALPKSKYVRVGGTE